VSRLSTRLRALERRHAPAGRCATCRGWRDCRVVHSDPQMHVLSERWAQEWDLPQPPERCPDCGWEPLTITVQYIEDWRPR
jgi:hypothetical protein